MGGRKKEQTFEDEISNCKHLFETMVFTAVRRGVATYPLPDA